MHADPAIYSHTPRPFILRLHSPQSPPYPRNFFLIFVSSIKVCIFVHFWCVCCLYSYRFWIQLYLCISDWQADQWIQLVMTSFSQNLPVVDTSAEKDRPWGPLPHGWTLTASALCYHNAGCQCHNEFMISMAVPFSENVILQSSCALVLSAPSSTMSPEKQREWHNWFICGWVLTWPATTLLKLGEAVLYEFKCSYVGRNNSRNHYPRTY